MHLITYCMIPAMWPARERKTIQTVNNKKQREEPLSQKTFEMDWKNLEREKTEARKEREEKKRMNQGKEPRVRGGSGRGLENLNHRRQQSDICQSRGDTAAQEFHIRRRSTDANVRKSTYRNAFWKKLIIKSSWGKELGVSLISESKTISCINCRTKYICYKSWW